MGGNREFDELFDVLVSDHFAGPMRERECATCKDEFAFYWEVAEHYLSIHVDILTREIKEILYRYMVATSHMREPIETS